MKAKHIHKYKRHVYKKTGTQIYFCTLPDCYHKIECATAVGKESLCNICSEPFIMGDRAAKLLRPHCDNCGKKLITDEHGKKYFVQRRGKKVVAHVAQEEVDSLRQRLANLDAVVTDDVEI